MFAFPVVVFVTVTPIVDVFTKVKLVTPRFTRACAALFAPVPPCVVDTTTGIFYLNWLQVHQVAAACCLLRATLDIPDSRCWRGLLECSRHLQDAKLQIC